MLQQTRVETATDYWLRFMEALPTVRDLAAASEERVLGLWSGLGYYRRARALRAAAGVIVDRHGGAFPRTRAELMELPGVGPYTAGAVLSIAFDLPEPVVDGNVIRVLSRLFAVEGDVSRSAVTRELWALAGALVPRPEEGGGAGEWNQALMELGATVCHPRTPDCDACPVRADCTARREGRTAELPRLPRRPEPIAVELVAVLAWKQGALLLERRPATGRMAGMWQLPTAERPGPSGTLSGLFPPGLPAGVAAGEELGSVRHAITRHRIRLTVCAPRTPPRVGRRADSPAWVPRDQLAELALTGMARKVLRAPFGLAAARGAAPGGR